MVSFKSLDQIALAMIDFLRLVQPELDTKPGTVSRDLFIDAPASAIAQLYSELQNVSNGQSYSSVSGSDLDALARNYGKTRGTGSPSSGTVFLCTNDLSTSQFYAAGSFVLSKSGLTFKTLSDVSLDPNKSNVYRANALRVQTELDLAGITDRYAVEVGIQCTQNGEVGNVGKFGVSASNLPGISNVVNLVSMSGGSSSETDTAFRNRLLAVFAGSNIGTALGYVNGLLADARIQDVLAVVPGDPLMTRDGTLVETNSNGDRVVINSGTGGKVDLYVQGSALEPFTESFIYKDQSGRGDPTSQANDFVMGQRSINPYLDFQQKRRLLLAAGTLPFQPVDTVVSIVGSSSGPNFTEKVVAADGSVSGSYELVKDEAAFGGSPFGFDKIHFISGSVQLADENETKGPFNGQDPLDFTDVSSIDGVRQEVSVVNEHPVVDSTDRSLLTLLHHPVLTATKVENVSTGERYTVAVQNPDGGSTNTTGRIKISGSTLPTSTDLLQVNYVWNDLFDENLDYDNLRSNVFTRTVQDSLDWGFANRIPEERQTVLYSNQDGYHLVVANLISRLVNVNSRLSDTATNVAGKLVVSQVVENIFSIRSPDGLEVFNTLAANGSFNSTEITLPTDALLDLGQVGTIIYNLADIYSPDGYDNGSFSGSIIRLPEGVASAGDTVFVDYIAAVSNLLPTTSLTSLPAVGDQNNFIVDSSVVGNQPVTNLYSGSTVVENLRFSPSYLKINLQGISSPGRLTLKGSSLTKIETVATILRDGLTIDLSGAIRTSLGLSQLPASIYVSSVESVERVSLANGTVSTVDFAFDTLNYGLKQATYSDQAALADSTLSPYSVRLSATPANEAARPITGEKVRLKFYVINSAEVENITATTSGVRVSKNRYVYVDRLSVSTGFLSLSGTVDGTVSIDPFTQPADGSAYFASYTYAAPKEGERIVVSYNYNRLISDSTFAVEKIRPVTADVLVKEAGTEPIDISGTITILSQNQNNASTIKQNVQEVLTSFITSRGLDATIDESDINKAATGVDQVDAFDVSLYNFSGLTGRVQSLSSDRNRYFTVGKIDLSTTIRTR